MRLREVTYACWLLLAILFSQCGARPTPADNDTTPDPAATQSVLSASDSTAIPEEGGTLTLHISGSTVTVPIDFAELTNTDEGYPDFVQFGGAGTFIVAGIDGKMPDDEGDGYYAPLVGKALPVNVSLDLVEGAREVTLPGLGLQPVAGGQITLEKFRRLGDGKDLWEGKIELSVQGPQGLMNIPGTFKVSIVPTW
ncbi:MAG TPA: hypothetical protein PLJ47_17950 [Candidatus Hydrogenedentes bacterium]|nr:hypothetical protein [Candidatus Hydrogenedentota bacterium]